MIKKGTELSKILLQFAVLLSPSVVQVVSMYSHMDTLGKMVDMNVNHLGETWPC